jgi:hypothetical protein
MAGKITFDMALAVSAASTQGVLTVGSTTGIYTDMRGYLYKSGQPGMVIQVAQVLSATTLAVRQIVEPLGGGVGASDITPQSSYGFQDCSAYTTGTLNLPSQVVMNPNDAPLN